MLWHDVALDIGTVFAKLLPPYVIFNVLSFLAPFEQPNASIIRLLIAVNRFEGGGEYTRKQQRKRK